MTRSSLCDYSDAYILVKGTVTVTQVAAPAQPQNDSKIVAFKNYAPFTDCIKEINNTQIGNPKYITETIWMNKSIKYIDNYLKTSGSVWQY